jgi:hypothetical protein
MKSQTEIKRLLEAVRRAEAELAATTRLSELKPVARVLIRAKAELKAAKQAAERS